MNPESIAHVATGGDVILEILKWLALAIVLLLMAANPLAAWWRKLQSDSADSAKDSATVTLYAQLQKQIKQNADDIRELVSEKNKYLEEIFALRQKVAEYTARQKEFEQSLVLIQKLREKLDEKDAMILERDAENKQLLRDMAAMKDRMHLLEVRLNKDEERFCADCTKGPKSSAQPASLTNPVQRFERDSL